MITIKLFADLRELAGVKELTLEAKTVAEAVLQLGSRFGPEFQNRLPRLALILNGENVKFLGGLKTKLQDGDTLSLLPPVAGGI